jgi:hypothetical protein
VLIAALLGKGIILVVEKVNKEKLQQKRSKFSCYWTQKANGSYY